MAKRLGCDYTGHEFGARYPDSICIDGYLWDLDSCDEPGGDLTSGGDLPCPKCNAKEWREYHRDAAHGDGYNAYYEGMSMAETPKFHGYGLVGAWRAGWREARADAIAEKKPKGQA